MMMVYCVRIKALNQSQYSTHNVDYSFICIIKNMNVPFKSTI